MGSLPRSLTKYLLVLSHLVSERGVCLAPRQRVPIPGLTACHFGAAFRESGVTRTMVFYKLAGYFFI